MGRRLALLIATYRYQDRGLGQLTSPAHDTEALAGVLRDPDIAGFEVTTLINEPHHRVGEAIGDFYRERRGDDLTLLYFTGHGLKDDNGRLYLAMTDTRRDSLLFTGLAAEHVDQAMEDCVSRQKVLILDCCYSGAYPSGRLTKGDAQVHTLERFQGRGRTVLTASDATQYSFEGGRARGEAAQSVFTRHLVRGLRDGSADLNGDGDITIDELYTYVHDRVVAEMPQQRPKKQENIEGRTVIARNVNWPLPAHVERAVTSPNAADRRGVLDTLANLYRAGDATVRDEAAERLRALAADEDRQVSAAATERLHSLLVSDTSVREERSASRREPVPPARSPRPRRRIVVLAATVLATLAAGIVFAVRTREPLAANVLQSLAIAPDGRHLYVTADVFPGHVWTIDTRTNKRSRAPFTVGVRPQGIAVEPDGFGVWVANTWGNSVSSIDLLSRTVNALIPVSAPLDVAVTPNGAHAFVTSAKPASIAVLDRRRNTIARAPIPLGAQPGHLAISPGGERVYVAAGNGVTVIDTTTFKVIGAPIVTGAGALSVAPSPDGTRLYVVNEEAGTVSVIDAKKNKVVADPIPVGNHPVDVAVSQDSRRIYVVRRYADSVSVIDTGTNAMVGHPIQVGRFPAAVIAAPDGRRVYVANGAGASVSVIDTATSKVIHEVDLAHG